MMLPILISVSLAPVSYFFCASAPLEQAAITANAVESTASFLVTDIYVSLHFCCMPVWRSLSGTLFSGTYLPSWPEHHNKKPPAPVARGAASLAAGRAALSRRRRHS